MEYYVYENWTAETKARIHLAECRWCNHGRGIHPEASRRNGRWHGPFANFNAARGAARQTGRPVSMCMHCDPG